MTAAAMIEHCRFAKAVLYHFAMTRRIPWGEYNSLLVSVLDMERSYVSCLTKETFESFAEAEKVVRRKLKSGYGARHAYHCRFCNKFHVGSHSPERTRQRKLQLRDLRAQRRAA